jgi:quercetin dioxygenase-like cupin family protein
MSAFADIGEVDPQRIWEGVVGRTVQGERLTFSLVEVDPNTAVPEHSHENEQVGMLVSGSMTFTVGDETRELGPGGTWCITANVPHSVVTGPGGAVLIEVFAPTRADWAGLERLPARKPDWPR